MKTPFVVLCYCLLLALLGMVVSTFLLVSNPDAAKIGGMPVLWLLLAAAITAPLMIGAETLTSETKWETDGDLFVTTSERFGWVFEIFLVIALAVVFIGPLILFLMTFEPGMGTAVKFLSVLPPLMTAAVVLLLWKLQKEYVVLI